MFWTATALLVGVTSALPQTRGPMAFASTYDDAACTDAEQEAEHPAEDKALNDCAERLPTTAPAVIDCNDARVSVWVAEMIGSCDMPKGGDRIAVVRAADPRTQNRLCDGLHCSREAPPLRAAVHHDGSGAPCLFARRALFPDLRATSLTADPQSSPEEVPLRRLERPPRTSA